MTQLDNLGLEMSDWYENRLLDLFLQINSLTPYYYYID